MTEPLCLAAMALPPGYQFPHPASEVARLASQILCACRQVRLRQTRPNFRVVMAFTAGYQFLRPRSELCCHTTPMLSGENATRKTQFLFCNGFSIRVPVYPNCAVGRRPRYYARAVRFGGATDPIHVSSYRFSHLATSFCVPDPNCAVRRFRYYARAVR